jgi:hypothetical protein
VIHLVARRQDLVRLVRLKDHDLRHVPLLGSAFT